ncbi:3985_t:CDS:2 [Paraglomus occultum]|uniref:3985_t:CDS:1 n=1 Tax=Paraglomus occultum TaxID=144539 RepID=A0A9N9CJZ7_9GLOM|nr:3985_t:CDS:2 [Paraglomus occultum]
MAIVNHMEKFTYVYTSQPGSMQVFKQSNFWSEVMDNPALRFPNDTHILGNSAFPLMPWLLVPFKERMTQRLTRPQRQYNNVHSSARMAVERAFGKLKGR